MIELQVLNTALLKEQALYDLLKYSSDIFQDSKHKIIYSLIEQLHSQDVKVDLPAVISESKRQDLYSKIGGDKLFSDVARLSPVFDHSHLLKNLEIERRKKFIKAASVDFLNAKINIDEFIDEVQPLFEIDIDVEDGINISDYVSQPLDNIFYSGISISTGLRKLDIEIGGLFKGDLTIIASRPGSGKTTLALQIARVIPENVLFFSFEMKKPQLLAKFINSLTGIPIIRILKNEINDSERKKVIDCIPIIAKYNITVFDNSDSFQTVLSQMRKQIRQKDSRVIILDYLQLIEGGKGNNPNEKIGYISRQLKKLAMNENIPIIALSQFSREVEKQDREPKLSDLRDSGSLEQDASTVLFIHDDSIIVGKCRLGRTGKISGFIHDKPYSRFIETDKVENIRCFGDY